MKNNRHIAVLLLLLSTFIISIQSQTTNYCNFPNCSHTLCLYPTAGPSPARCTNAQGYGLTDSEKQRILTAHNAFRRRVASGLETRGNPGPQPAAVNIGNLTWNAEIATIAQRWSDQCIFDSDMCRRTSQYPYVNQNIAAMLTTRNVSSIQVESLIQLWTDSVANFNRNTVTNYSFNSQSGTYSQVVWANTTDLGCGATKYFDGQYNRFYLVCNYAPGGNVQGQSVYQPVS